MKNLAEFEIIGRVGRITTHDNATRVSICANYRYQDDGAWKDDPHWNDVVVFSRQLREYVSQKVAKGALVHARGRIRQSQFKDAATNETRYTTDLVAVDIGGRLLNEKRLHAITVLGIIGTAGFLFVQAADNETIQTQAQEISGRIEHGLREGSRRVVLTRDLPDVLTGAAEVIDGRTLRYVDTDLTVRLVGIEICAPDQKATFAGTPWPCADMATAWLVSQTLGRDLQCQRLGRQFNGTINARCAIDGADIAGEAILAGHALVNRKTRPGVPIPLAAYIELEDRARTARTGLWSNDFTRPKDYRRQRVRENSAPSRPLDVVPLETDPRGSPVIPSIDDSVSP